MSALAANTPASPEQAAERPLKILAFAYACSPGEGSEPGAGWTWTRLLARLGEVWVVTRENNREAIERSLEEIPERHRVHPVYVDLPPWARFWKRGQRGARVYYLLWQAAALRNGKRVIQEERIDLVWHVTLANAWLGSVGALAGRPFVYGPVGGGLGPPARLLPSLGLRGAAYEVLRGLVRWSARYLNPLARLSWRRAGLILTLNPETGDWLPRRHAAKTVVFRNAVLMEPAGAIAYSGSPTALLAARLLAWKGGALAVHAIAQAPAWTLLVCGAGPDERRLRRLAAHLGVANRIHFLGRVSRSSVLRLMEREASVLLHPSMHDDCPLVVAEAAARGLPVVCLDRGGPPLLAGSTAVAVPTDGGSRRVVSELARALDRAASLELQPDDSRGFERVAVDLERVVEASLPFAEATAR